jgi:hypothetical protein
MKDKLPNYLVVYKNEKTGEIKLIKLLKPVNIRTSRYLFEFKYNNSYDARVFATYLPDSVKLDLEDGTLNYIIDLYNLTVYYSKRNNFANITINLN